MWRFRKYPILQESGDGQEGAGGGGSPGEESGAGDQGEGAGAGGGGMLRAAAQAGASGEGEGEGEGGDDPDFVTDAADGRPKIKTEDGREIPMPDQFWDHENQTVRADALFKSQLDTRKALRSAQDKAKQLEARLAGEGEGSGKVPEKAEDYKLEMPEGAKREIPDNDPLLTSFKEIAHANGVSQEKFNAMAGQFMQKIDELSGDPIDPDKEREALGPNAGAVLGAVAEWANGLQSAGILSQTEHDEILSIGETAAGVRALNKIRERMGEKRIPLEGAKVDDLPSEQELYKMIGSKEYAEDETYRKKVDDMAKKVWGTSPAGSSRPGLGVGG